MLSAERVRRGLSPGSRFDDVRVLDVVDSTNRVVRDLADAGAPEGVVVVADHQTAGRGRLGRAWEAPGGTALLMSMLLRPDLPVTRLSLVTAVVALGARQACEEIAGFTPELKWPNDLLVGEAKLAGILAEASLGAVVVGVGLNVSAAPPGAISAEVAAGRPVDRAELLVRLLDDVDVRVGRVGAWERVLADYREACATIGRRVVVTTAGGEMTGRAEAVDDHGRLVVRDPAGATAVLAAGDVVHVRPQSGR